MEEEEGAGDGEEEDVDMQDEITGPLLMLEEAKHRLASEYAAKSMYARYGVHNEYIAFKKLWHDAVHGAEGKPLPDASRWFAEDGRGQNRQQEHDGHEHGNDDAGDDDDDDDDLVIDQEHVSLHCPLTLQIMKEPYTSHKCRHTFDKTSIQQFLGKTSKQCPQTGCSEMVAFKDFYFDQIMLRRIKRAEAASNNDTMMDDDDDDEAGYDEEPTMASVKMTQERAVKTERGAAGSSRRGRRGEDVEDEDE
ncbi:zinc-finger of the MIZ type in Nse subunit-domain-containing protein [Microdochium trichocladiopsis]|uniref:Zinc-finger of the MIZ type in Nse subunit-domain-containing protein n=1 Tax=Microdochium trichocladiopsis TaxID=1682393 RepID=A0A9P8YHW7_9PEZI|nr:zinc-finger of the MIZ type in Nse subunit-domain-containing protein [Microdochium trichocladiopsis]KAH7040313.1 zinc-finger of the MIZ type in Nse subunit-domain-containing protein [Microdochium trichocladiopsis]